MSIAQVYVDESIADFRLKINSGQTLILVLETQGWFTVGGNYTLNIAYQSKKNCNRFWGTDRLLLFDFTY